MINIMIIIIIIIVIVIVIVIIIIRRLETLSFTACSFLDYGALHR